MINWHRLFGLIFSDQFINTPYNVRLEMDLSTQKQLLDVIILRKEEGRFPGPLPDGLNNLAEHNLLTYKSLREPLDAWAIDELLGHLVNYRKQVSRDLPRLLPLDRFHLYGISTRFPTKLSKEVKLEKKQEGVYETVWGTHTISILVLTEMMDKPENAVWEMFSTRPEKIVSGVEHYRPRQPNISTVINELFDYYRVKGLFMRQTIEEFQEEIMRRQMAKLRPEVRLEGLPVEERLKGLPVEERLKGLPVEERLKGLPVEERLKGLSTEERLRGLPVEELEAYIQRQKQPEK